MFSIRAPMLHFSPACRFLAPESIQQRSPSAGKQLAPGGEITNETKLSGCAVHKIFSGSNSFIIGWWDSTAKVKLKQILKLDANKAIGPIEKMSLNCHNRLEKNMEFLQKNIE